jgi:S-disulfanyl-L-cysteine oxidoreductase SoxD
MNRGARRCLARGGVGLAGVLVLIASAHAQQMSKTTAQGVFTEAQATRGQKAYMDSCARCHAEDLLGASGPALVGDFFTNRFVGSNVQEIVKTVRRSMPQEAPDSLGTPMYVDIASFILKSNGSPTGAAELPTDAETLLQIQVASRQ